MSAISDYPHRILSVNYERLFTQMIVLSVAAHFAVFVLALTLPGLLPQKAQPEPKAIDVDLTNILPKGPSLGPKAPDITQEAARHSDPRKASEIMKEKQEQYDSNTVKLTEKRQVVTNKLDWKDRMRMEAIEKVRQQKALMESVGGGGTGETSTSGILGIYIAKVKSQILAVWSLPGGLPEKYLEKIVQVRVFIAPSGNIIDKTLVNGTGFEPLDRSCLSAVVKANPLPPPPAVLADELKKKGILVRFHPIEKQH